MRAPLLNLVFAMLLALSFVTGSSHGTMPEQTMPMPSTMHMMSMEHSDHGMSSDHHSPRPEVKHDCVSCLGCACSTPSITLNSLPLSFTVQPLQALASTNPRGRAPALEPQPPRQFV